MNISAKSAAAFGITTGVGGLILGNIVLGNEGYVAPALFGGVVGWGVNLSGGEDYPAIYAITTGAAAALTARLIAGLMIKNEDLTSDEAALSATRRALFGATLGAAVLGLVAPRFNSQLLEA